MQFNIKVNSDKFSFSVTEYKIKLVPHTGTNESMKAAAHDIDEREDAWKCPPHGCFKINNHL